MGYEDPTSITLHFKRMQLHDQTIIKLTIAIMILGATFILAWQKYNAIQLLQIHTLIGQQIGQQIRELEESRCDFDKRASALEERLRGKNQRGEELCQRLLGEGRGR